MKEVVVDVLEKTLKKIGVKLSNTEIEKLIEVPPSIEMGDFAFPCFSLAVKLKKSPNEIAIDLREAIQTPNSTDFDDIQTKGPYVNFFLDRKNLARKIIFEAITKKKEYGKSKLGKGKKIVIELSSPNIAKPFGIGHLRSTIIGNSIANISEFLGYKPVRVNYLGDWGTQFGKIIFGYEKFGSEKKLMKNPISHLLDIYVKASNKKYEESARACFKKLEGKDKKYLMLWKLFKTLSLKEFEKIYKELGIKFDYYDSESMHEKGMKRVMEELNKKKLVQKSKGALIVDLTKFGLDICLIQKTDGATLYSTRDLAAAIKRYETYKFDKMIYEVGQEQNLHFKQIFKILELMGYDFSKNCIHVEHGLYLDKKGKRFATRKGKTIFMEDVIKETEALAKKEIKKRFPKLSQKEMDFRAHRVAIAAIFYGDLKNSRKNNIVFDIDRFVSFDGDTGPYLLYSYARAGSILQKTKNNDKLVIPELENKELELIQKLSQFNETVQKAFDSMSPSVVANYSYGLAKLFNEFYHECPVIGSQQEAFRLALVEAFRIVLKNSLSLLGISVLEEM